MAVSNPAAVKFCNERVRVLADQIARVHTTITLFAGEFAAKGLADIIPNDANEIILDGAESDGRTPINGADVYLMLTLANDLLEMSTGPSSKMGTVLKVAVNPI
jgi:hypothetical protein